MTIERTSTMPSISVVIPVYRRAAQACTTIDALLSQAPSDAEIVVVDDGSGDGTAERIEATFGDRIRLLRLETNRGRAQARSHGIAHARGERIVLIDCDCVPSTPDYLARLRAALDDGAVAATGPIRGFGDSFWDRYQHLASMRRAAQVRAGVGGIGSSANMAFLKRAYESCGGFDPRYRHYGFEDRDLLLRLSSQGRVAWVPEAEVAHMDALSMVEVGAKMREAGRHSAAMFERDHPQAYVASGYATLDARRRPALRPLAALSAPLLPGLARTVDRMTAWTLLPFALRAQFVRLVGGLHFMQGTWQASRDAGRDGR